MTRILSGDVLIADVIAPVEGNAALAALAQKYRMVPGAKQALDDTQLQEFSAALEGATAIVTPGGSSANMLTTLGKLLGKEIEVRFLGMAGDGAYGTLIRDAFAEAGIALVPERFPPSHVVLQSAISFVLVYPDGQCSIATYAGNARDILKPAMIPEHLVKNSDVVLMQGSLWHKFHPEFAGRLLKLCIQHHKQLWLTLPTQANLSKDETAGFMRGLPTAILVLGNHAELERLYGKDLKTSLRQLQVLFKDREERAIGFITLGKDGAAVVSAEGVEYIKPVAAEIRNTLGAGDTSYAGFVAGYIKKLPDATSARIAMVLAAEKLRVNSSRLADPRAVLAAQAAELSQLLGKP